MSTDSTPSPPRAGSLIASSNGGFTLSAGELAAIHHEMGHYEDPRAASIEALKIVQAAHGWVADGAIEALATVLGISAADIEGVATFYNMIFRQPVGRHVIKVCDSIACFLTGQEALKQAIVAHTGIGYGATTTDERFTLLPVCCLGNCDKGPTLMIDDDTHGPVAPEQVPALLERYR
ncbi:MAG: NADH-quinone oxidoreductase subunit NuoE [Gammaproteobacteria bacterium]|jgi:NADH-quinone oxidoreductase subunit E|nr:NADH-quinone oxidoreductase subunit NuoE [Gammaproteobacteria bacterium]MBP6051511.1 NADH-quinone oxidoreductase subunit NuoE [Pseudomonadales bacterium]MBK6582638.1 NADH-quinone oxidoreductase subunit NuoE [Gammaproteobacteria bacterium]MBK7518770.1 NADH-quinone oxidoreductase subunit NuoE [Gammaproteobacteria bacterium]MBK7730483.1 NADH-quinone oxidoreductase subunit NuoE [Gammaproteobacteria bacterium]